MIADQLTVSETATETPQDEGTSINSPRNLSMEAMYINHNFSQQVLKMVSVWSRLQVGRTVWFVHNCTTSTTH